MMKRLSGCACAASLVFLGGCASMQQTPAPAASSEMEAQAGTVEVEATAPVTGSAEVEVEVEEMEYEPAAPLLAPIPERLNAVEFLDDELFCRVVVQKTTYRRTPTNTFEVMASFKNMTEKKIRLKVRTQYFDGERISQEGPGAWQFVYLPPMGIETYKTNSYRTDVQYYYIEVAEHCD